MLYHSMRPLGKLNPFPTPLSAFYADEGISFRSGNDILQWDDQINGGGLGSQNNFEPTRLASQGGLAPTVNFTPAATTPRLFGSGSAIINAWDNNGSGRSECSVVFYLNANITTTGLDCVFSSAGGGNTRRWWVRPRAGSGFQVASTVDGGSTFRLLRATALPANTATVVVITREADGTTVIYYDGVPQTITTNTFPVGTFFPNIDMLCLGDNVLNTTGPVFEDEDWDGQISALEFYDVPLTQDQVTELTATLQARF